MKITYKKVFLKYQVNARFLSLCLHPEEAIFGSGRRKKSQQAHRGSRRRTGCPNDSLKYTNGPYGP